MRRVNQDPAWRLDLKIREAASMQVRELMTREQSRAQLRIAMIREMEPDASADRIAQILLLRYKKLASWEGGLTGIVGFLGVPTDFILFTYFQIALVVSIAEVYGRPMKGEAGEAQLLGILGRAHGLENALRSTPRLLGALAKALTKKYGFSTLGRLVPLISAPIAARMNAKDIERTGNEALRQLAKVFVIT